MDLGMVLGQASELVLSSVRIPGRFKIDVSTVQGFGLGFAHCHVLVFASSSSSSTKYIRKQKLHGMYLYM